MYSTKYYHFQLNSTYDDNTSLPKVGWKKTLIYLTTTNSLISYPIHSSIIINTNNTNYLVNDIPYQDLQDLEYLENLKQIQIKITNVELKTRHYSLNTNFNYNKSYDNNSNLNCNSNLLSNNYQELSKIVSKYLASIYLTKYSIDSSYLTTNINTHDLKAHKKQQNQKNQQDQQDQQDHLIQQSQANINNLNETQLNVNYTFDEYSYPNTSNNIKSFNDTHSNTNNSNFESKPKTCIVYHIDPIDLTTYQHIEEIIDHHDLDDKHHNLFQHHELGFGLFTSKELREEHLNSDDYYINNNLNSYSDRLFEHTNDNIATNSQNSQQKSTLTNNILSSYSPSNSNNVTNITNTTSKANLEQQDIDTRLITELDLNAVVEDSVESDHNNKIKHFVQNQQNLTHTSSEIQKTQPHYHTIILTTHKDNIENETQLKAELYNRKNITLTSIDKTKSHRHTANTQFHITKKYIEDHIEHLNDNLNIKLTETTTNDNLNYNNSDSNINKNNTETNILKVSTNKVNINNTLPYHNLPFLKRHLKAIQVDWHNFIDFFHAIELDIKRIVKIIDRKFIIARKNTVKIIKNKSTKHKLDLLYRAIYWQTPTFQTNIVVKNFDEAKERDLRKSQMTFTNIYQYDGSIADTNIDKDNGNTTIFNPANPLNPANPTSIYHIDNLDSLALAQMYISLKQNLNSHLVKPISTKVSNLYSNSEQINIRLENNSIENTNLKNNNLEVKFNNKNQLNLIKTLNSNYNYKKYNHNYQNIWLSILYDYSRNVFIMENSDKNIDNDGALIYNTLINTDLINHINNHNTITDNEQGLSEQSTIVLASLFSKLLNLYSNYKVNPVITKIATQHLSHSRTLSDINLKFPNLKSKHNLNSDCYYYCHFNLEQQHKSIPVLTSKHLEVKTYPYTINVNLDHNNTTFIHSNKNKKNELKTSYHRAYVYSFNNPVSLQSLKLENNIYHNNDLIIYYPTLDILAQIFQKLDQEPYLNLSDIELKTLKLTVHNYNPEYIKSTELTTQNTNIKKSKIFNQKDNTQNISNNIELYEQIKQTTAILTLNKPLLAQFDHSIHQKFSYHLNEKLNQLCDNSNLNSYLNPSLNPNINLQPSSIKTTNSKYQSFHITNTKNNTSINTNPSNTSSAKTQDNNEAITTNIEPDYDALTSYQQQLHQRIPHKFILVTLLVLISIIPGLENTSLSPGVTQIQSHYGTNVIALQSFYLCGLGLGQLFWGPYIDRWGRKAIVIVCSLLGLTINFSMIMATQGWELYLNRICQGFCFGGLGLCPTIILKDIFSTRDFVIYNSWVVLLFLYSPALGPLWGGYVVVNLGWHWIFIILSITLAILLIFFIFLIPETKPPRTFVHNNFKTTLKYHKEILTNTRALFLITFNVGYSITVFSLPVLVPVVLLKIYDIPPNHLGFYLAIPLIFTIVGNRLNVMLVKRNLSPRRIWITASITQSLFTIVNFTVSILFLGPPGIIASFCVNLFFNGFQLGNIQSLYLMLFPHCVATANSVMSFFRFVIPSLIVFGISRLPKEDGATLLHFDAITIITCTTLTIIYALKFKPYIDKQHDVIEYEKHVHQKEEKRELHKHLKQEHKLKTQHQLQVIDRAKHIKHIHQLRLYNHATATNNLKQSTYDQNRQPNIDHHIVQDQSENNINQDNKS